jgi:hypothetical protein
MLRGTDPPLQLSLFGTTPPKNETTCLAEELCGVAVEQLEEPHDGVIGAALGFQAKFLRVGQALGRWG